MRESWGGTPVFLHGRIRPDCSDFHLIFEPIYARLQDLVLLVDTQVIEEHAVATISRTASDRSGYCAIQGSALTLVGRSMPEFDDQLILAYDTFSDVVDRDEKPWEFADPSKRKRPRNRWKPGLHTLIHNYDGIFWQIFSVDASLCDALVQKHRRQDALALFRAEFSKDYPASPRETLFPFE